jgi:hypothetical protein
MKILFITAAHIFFFVNSYAQSNHVFAGGEILNFDTVDISVNHTTTWTSDRSFNPGYFSSFGNAIYIGYSDSINFDGYVKKYGNTSFVFPVGSKYDLRTLAISKPAYITDTYATAWMEGDPSYYRDPTPPYAGYHSIASVKEPIVLVSKTGQWDWQIGEGNNLGFGTTGNGVGLTITLSMPDMTDFAKPSELRLVGWNGNSWIDLSGKPTATGNIEDCSISGTMVAGISSIAIGKTSNSYNAILFPNPVSQFENIQLRFNSYYTGAAELIIYNVLGQKILLQSVQISNGINTIPINVMNLTKGGYYIDLISDKGERMLTGKRFVKL